MILSLKKLFSSCSQHHETQSLLLSPLIWIKSRLDLLFKSIKYLHFSKISPEKKPFPLYSIIGCTYSSHIFLKNFKLVVWVGLKSTRREALPTKSTLPSLLGRKVTLLNNPSQSWTVPVSHPLIGICYRKELIFLHRGTPSLDRPCCRGSAYSDIFSSWCCLSPCWVYLTSIDEHMTKIHNQYSFSANKLKKL